MSEVNKSCINGRSVCLHGNELHYHTEWGDDRSTHCDDEVTRAFAALAPYKAACVRLAEATRAYGHTRAQQCEAVTAPGLYAAAERTASKEIDAAMAECIRLGSEAAKEKA